MGVMIRMFHYIMILAAYVRYSNHNFIHAESDESSMLYINPTDHSSGNITGRCPQNGCLTLIESDFNDLSTNKIDTIVLLPGVHIINTTKPDITIRSSGAVVFTGDSNVTIWCTNTIVHTVFEFYTSQIEVSNIKFKSCGGLFFSPESNIEVRDVTINGKHGDEGIIIENSDHYSPKSCRHVNNTILLYNLNINLNAVGVVYTQNCDPPDDFYCTHTSSTSLHLRNSTLYMANIYISAKCTVIDLQRVTIKQISSSYLRKILTHGSHNPMNLFFYDESESESDSAGDIPAFFIYDAVKVSLEDISIEDSVTYSSLVMLWIVQCYTVELKGHILFRNNSNNKKMAYFDDIYHSVRIFSHSKIEFYGNRDIYGSLLEVHRYKFPDSTTEKYYDGKIYIEGHQHTSTKLLFKNNELFQGSSLMIIETGIKDFHLNSPGLFAYNTEFMFENNSILRDSKDKYKDIFAVLLFFQSVAAVANTSMLFVNNSVPAGGVFVMVSSAIHILPWNVGDHNDFYAEFVNNEGNDGGAMTFYKGSYIGILLETKFWQHLSSLITWQIKEEAQFLLRILSILGTDLMKYMMFLHFLDQMYILNLTSSIILPE